METTLIDSRPELRGAASPRVSIYRRIATFVPPILLLLCLIRLWVMPLWSSLWVDEMGTLFVIHFGSAHPSLKVAPQVADSIYYFLPRITERLFGQSEASYRLGSLLCMGAALFVIARIAARLIHPRAAWFVMFCAVALRGFDYQAADARPYALGTLVASASVLFCIRWLDSGRLRDALFFLCAAALLWRVHLIFWPFYIVLGAYVLVRVWSADTPVRRRDAVLALLLLAVSLLPVFARALMLLAGARAHVIVPPPSLNDLLGAIKISFVTAVCAAALARRARRRQKVEAGPSRSTRVLILGWWLGPPLCLFAFSWITGESVFVSRYVFIALPGAALAAAAFIEPLVPRERWLPLSCVLGAGVLLFVGGWQHRPVHHKSDWKSASAAITRLALPAGTPLICPSPFIEARPPVWTPTYPLPGFLYSHLLVYPVRGTVYPFPFEMSPEAASNAAHLLQRTIPDAHRFLIYGGDRNVWLWQAWFSPRPELTGWKSRRLGKFGDVEAVLFEAPPGSSTPIAALAAVTSQSKSLQ